MIHDGLVRRVNGQPELVGWQLARRRTEKKLRSAFRFGQQVDLSPNGKASRSGRVAAGRAMVRAETIIAMLRAGPSSGHGARLMLRRAYITGRLDLSYSRIDQPISLCDCVFDEPIVATEARLSALTLDGSTFPGIEAQNLEVDGDLGLDHVSSTRTVHLTGAHLHRDLRLRGAHLRRGEGQDDALAADHLVVEGSVTCCGRFEATGTVTMAGARVSGSVRLGGARIIAGGTGKAAFDGDGMTVGHNFNAQYLIAEGEVRLVDARIASALELQGAELTNADGFALLLDRAEISSSLYCSRGFTARGKIQAIGTHVKGSIYLNRAELGVPMPDSGADGPPARDPALRLVRARIEGDLWCRDYFISHGPIDLSRLSVGGEFRLDTTGLKGNSTAANLTNGRFATLTIIGGPPAGFLDLTKAKADFFQDGPAARWRIDRGVIILDEFEYRTIQMTNVTVEQRKQWLRQAMEASRRNSGAHDGYLPQPYEQLAGAYRRAGDDQSARRIQLAKYRQRNRMTRWGLWYIKLWNILQDVAIGYGYKPLRALVLLLVLFVFGLLLFRYSARPYSIVGVHHHPGFALSNSAGYTLNLLLPASALDERQAWQSANGMGEVVAASLVVFGWLLTATVFAAAARVLQRN
jgi:hypothetical protein